MPCVPIILYIVFGSRLKFANKKKKKKIYKYTVSLYSANASSILIPSAI